MRCSVLPFFPNLTHVALKKTNKWTNKTLRPELGILIVLSLSLSVSQTGSPPPRAPLLLLCAFCLFEMKLWCTYGTQSSPSAGTPPHTLTHARRAHCRHPTRTWLRVFTVAAFDCHCLLGHCRCTEAGTRQVKRRPLSWRGWQTLLQDDPHSNYMFFCSPLFIFAPLKYAHEPLN